MLSIRRPTPWWLSVPVVLAVMALAPASAPAFNNPTARATCAGPVSLGCQPCPTSVARCADPTGYVAPGVNVTFDGSASTDVPPGAIAQYSWNFNDGGTSSSNSPQTLHSFGTPGVKLVNLQVRDDQNQTGATQIAIVVGARLLTTPSPGIVLGSGALSISAEVIGRDNPGVGATLDFRLFGPDNAACAGAPVFQQLGVPYPVTGGAVSSAPFTPTLAGTYRWAVSYLGDAVNHPEPLGCGAAVVVSPPPPPPPPPPAPVPPPPVADGVGPNPECFGKAATIVAIAGRSEITGTPGRDVIVGGDADDRIDGRGGNDTICARGGDDTVRGSAGNDRVYGGLGRDLLLGGTGADTLFGQRGGDRLGGGSGADRADGGAGDDLLDESKLGGSGKDRLVGGSGADAVRTADETNDSVDCGPGRDNARLDRGDRQRRCDDVRRVD